MRNLLLLILLPVMAFAADPQALKRREPFGSVLVQPQQKRVALAAEDDLKLRAADAETAMEGQDFFAAANAHLPDNPVVMVLDNSGDKCERVDTDNHQTIIGVRSRNEDVSALEMYRAPKKTGRKKQKQPAQQRQSTSGSQPYKKVRVVRVLGADKQIGRDSLAIEQRKNQLLQQQKDDALESLLYLGRCQEASVDFSADDYEKYAKQNSDGETAMEGQGFFAAANAHLLDNAVMVLDDSGDGCEEVDTDNHQTIIGVHSSAEEASVDEAALLLQEITNRASGSNGDLPNIIRPINVCHRGRQSKIDSMLGCAGFIKKMRQAGKSQKEIVDQWNKRLKKLGKEERLYQSDISRWSFKNKAFLESFADIDERDALDDDASHEIDILQEDGAFSSNGDLPNITRPIYARSPGSKSKIDSMPGCAEFIRKMRQTGKSQKEIADQWNKRLKKLGKEERLYQSDISRWSFKNKAFLESFADIDERDALDDDASHEIDILQEDRASSSNGDLPNITRPIHARSRVGRSKIDKMQGCAGFIKKMSQEGKSQREIVEQWNTPRPKKYEISEKILCTWGLRNTGALKATGWKSKIDKIPGCAEFIKAMSQEGKSQREILVQWNTQHERLEDKITITDISIWRSRNKKGTDGKSKIDRMPECAQFIKERQNL